MTPEEELAQLRIFAADTRAAIEDLDSDGYKHDAEIKRLRSDLTYYEDRINDLMEDLHG